jgi:predicted RNA-binding protein YlxR (DUF448 family)
MQEATSEISTRTCVGCREKDDRSALLRLVAMPAERTHGDRHDRRDSPIALVPDVRKREPGRGVSVHARLGCLEGAIASGAFKRAFRGPVATTARELAHSAREGYERRAQGLLIAARRAHKLALGTEAVREAIAERRARLLVVAVDAEGSREELERAAERLGRACLVWNSKQGLGRLFSRPTLSILAVLDIGIADELLSVVRAAAELAEDA